MTPEFDLQAPRCRATPLGRARLKVVPEDFVVVERLSFEPAGAGEHVYLRLRKRDQNTDWLAARLAELTGRPRVDVGYAGLKDRRAVTEQWFSLRWPGQSAPDISGLEALGVSCLELSRHSLKLRRGALRSNRFRLQLRGLDADRDAVDGELAIIAGRGFPNRYGRQRFGRGGVNLPRAWDMMQGGRRPRGRQARSMLLSAARSWLFNRVLDRRIGDESWDRILPGEAVNLAGSRSWFLAQPGDTALAGRLAAGDVHPSGPQWGRGELPSRADCRALEEETLARWGVFREGLAAAGLSQERRPLRCIPVGLVHRWIGADRLELEFELPRGSYATTLVEQLFEIDEGPEAPADQRDRSST